MRTIFLLLVLLVTLSIYGKSYYTVTEKTQISLLTASPGQDLYATFGHSAIRIKDPSAGFDIVFNYGAFDFDEPGFYWHFIKGRLDYLLVIVKTEKFISIYKEENRLLVENALHLDSAQKQAVFDYLMWNAELENRQYKYDFFYDNCATRIRDVFEKQLGGSIQLNYADTAFRSHVSMRKMLDMYLSGRPWTKLDFYLILGLPADAEATSRMQSFLPDYLKIAFMKATDHGRPMTGEDIIICQPVERSVVPNALFDATLILPLLILFILYVPLCFRKPGIGVFAVLFITGLSGIFFLFMWFDTDHISTYKNLNLFWALPWNWLMAFMMLTARCKGYVQRYIRLYGYWLIIVLLLSFILPQPYHLSVRISILLIGLYLFYISRRNIPVT